MKHALGNRAYAFNKTPPRLCLLFSCTDKGPWGKPLARPVKASDLADAQRWVSNHEAITPELLLGNCNIVMPLCEVKARHGGGKHASVLKQFPAVNA